MELTEILLNLLFIVCAIGIWIIIVLHNSNNYKVKNYKVVGFILLILFFLLIFSQYSLGYEEQFTVLSGDDYYLYDVNTSETPIQINKTLYNLDYSNTTNWTMYQIMCGVYVTCDDEFNSSNGNQAINITIDFDEDEVGTYNTWVRVLDLSDNIVNETYFRFDVDYGDVANESVNYSAIPFGHISPGLWTGEYYDAELPETEVINHNIKSQSGYYMTINCTGDLECSNDYIATDDITTFTSTLSIPENKAIGTYESYIYLNTSYNKSGNITVRYKVKDTPIEVIKTEVLKTKDINNMTQEELVDYWKQIKDVSNEAIAKIQAAEPKKEIIEKNITVPYMANKDEIVNAVVKKVTDLVNKDAIKLSNDIYNDAEVYRNKYFLANYTIHNQSLLISNLEKDKNYLEIERMTALRKQNSTIHEKNFVVKKSSFLWSLLGLILLSGLLVGYIFYERQAIGDY